MLFSRAPSAGVKRKLTSPDKLHSQPPDSMPPPYPPRAKNSGGVFRIFIPEHPSSPAAPDHLHFDRVTRGWREESSHAVRYLYTVGNFYNSPAIAVLRWRMLIYYASVDGLSERIKIQYFRFHVCRRLWNEEVYTSKYIKLRVFALKLNTPKNLTIPRNPLGLFHTGVLAEKALMNEELST